MNYNFKGLMDALDELWTRGWMMELIIHYNYQYSPIHTPQQSTVVRTQYAIIAHAVS